MMLLWWCYEDAMKMMLMGQARGFCFSEWKSHSTLQWVAILRNIILTISEIVPERVEASAFDFPLVKFSSCGQWQCALWIWKSVTFRWRTRLCSCALGSQHRYWRSMCGFLWKRRAEMLESLNWKMAMLCRKWCVCDGWNICAKNDRENHGTITCSKIEGIWSSAGLLDHRCFILRSQMWNNRLVHFLPDLSCVVLTTERNGNLEKCLRHNMAT